MRQSDRSAQTRWALLLLCGLLLAGAFLYAGGLHFAALRYGYQTETLRRERDRLLEGQRRFLLAREEAASPARLERAARQLGMQPIQPEQIEPPRTARTGSGEKKSLVMNRPAASPAADKSKRQRLETPR